MNIYTAETNEELGEVKRALRDKYGDKFDRLAAMFFSIDPIDINYGYNADEYESEVCALLPEMYPNISLEAIIEVLNKVFLHYFGEESVQEAGEKFLELATGIHKLYLDVASEATDEKA